MKNWFNKQDRKIVVELPLFSIIESALDDDYRRSILSGAEGISAWFADLA